MRRNSKLDEAIHLTTTRLVIAKENILCLEGVHDLLSPEDNIADLLQSRCAAQFARHG